MHFRTLIYSDLHAGKSCWPAIHALTRFLIEHTADKVLMLGDVFDGFKKDSNATRLFHVIAARVADGQPALWVEGNHDENLLRGDARDFIRNELGCITAESVTFPLADGRKAFATHGHQFDSMRSAAFNRASAFNENALAKMNAEQADVLFYGHIHESTHMPLPDGRSMMCSDMIKTHNVIVEDRDGTLRHIDLGPYMHGNPCELYTDFVNASQHRRNLIDLAHEMHERVKAFWAFQRMPVHPAGTKARLSVPLGNVSL